MKIGYEWFLAFQKIGKDNFFNLDNLKIFEGENGHFIADPFCIKKNGVYWIFYEDCNYKKGVIKCIGLDNDLNITFNPKTILENTYHFSFPCLLEDDDKLYLIPETYKNNTIDLYECINVPDDWKFKKTLLNLPGKDSIVFKHNHMYWIFTTLGKNNNLTIFYTDSLLGEWVKHPISKNYYNFKSKRNAGQIIKIDEKIIRPTQFDIREYGENIVFNEIIKLTETEFEEVEMSRISPNWECKDYIGKWNLKNTHTFNKADDFMVIDGNKQIFYDYTKYL